MKKIIAIIALLFVGCGATLQLVGMQKPGTHKRKFECGESPHSTGGSNKKQTLSPDDNVTVIVASNVFINSCLENYTDEALELLPNIDVTYVDENGWTPLHAACTTNNWKLIHTLLKKGADINKKTHQLTALVQACDYANEDVVKSLFWHGAKLQPATDVRVSFAKDIQKLLAQLSKPDWTKKKGTLPR
jgi:hypothetical protein